MMPATVSEALGTMARALVTVGESPSAVGSVTLLPHQREGADRLRAIIARHGGALLCDAVGVGKTYVALAIAQHFSRTLVIAPAVLREMWRRAIAAAGITADVVSVESLGRRTRRTPENRTAGSRTPSAPLVIIDEAHHLRNPATRRYDAAARLCASARTLLLTATPLHNRRRDLAALVALFAGIRAHAWTDEELASVIVRRERSVVRALAIPRVEHMPPSTLSSGDPRVLNAVLALPPPVPPSNGDDGAVLVTHALVRQWASSTAALAGALRRRIARGHALLAALDDGRYPTRSELRDWVCTEDSVQLAFTQLLAASPATDPALRSALDRHVDALVALLHTVERDDAADRERAAIVRDVCDRHAPARVVAFTCYQETAEMIYRALRTTTRAALLTARGGVIASGRLSRAETIARFAPEACGRGRVADHERIDLLVATDLLSEGVNLQDAAVTIHLDLPWTSARLAQRVGRVARVGSRHAVVTTYTLRPSPRAESVIHAAQTIHRKALLDARILGATADAAAASCEIATPPLASDRTPLECAEEIQRLLRGYLRCAMPRDTAIPIAHVAASRECTVDDCALVACLIDGAPQLLVVTNDRVDAAPQAALAALAVALSCPADTQRGGAHDAGSECAPVLRAIDAWHSRRLAALDAGVDVPVGSGRARAALRGRRRTIGRLDAAVSSSTFAQRDSAAARAASLRALAATPMPVGAERGLYDDDAPPIRPPRPESAPRRFEAASEGVRVVALLLLRPTG